MSIELSEDLLRKCVADTSKLFDSQVFLVKKGKVRDVYEINNSKELNYNLVASDRISAFDRNLTTIPYKGIVLHKVSKWWFDKTKHIVPNHVVESIDERTMKVKKCKCFSN